MSSPSPTLSTPRRPRRESRFTEGSETTRPDMLTQPPTSTEQELLFTILSEMDEHEKRRKRGGSNSSVESFTSSASNGISPVSPTMKDGREREGRKNIIFGGRPDVVVRRSLDERPRGIHEGGLGANQLASKVKGRLRALTGERRKDVNVKPYPGT